MIALILATLVASDVPPAVSLSEAAHAIESNRLVQARRMLADAISGGQRGAEVDRLLADLAFADRKWSEAQARYSELLSANADDPHLAERAGIASLMTGDKASARRLIDKAISLGATSWQVWNALGVLCDFQHDWDCADAAYATAGEALPNRAEVLNNHGWSLILRGEWASAVEVLERAVQLDPGSERMANNLELARAAVSASLPRRRSRESDVDFAARLNDAGIAAEKLGDSDRAIAAFSRALAVSDSWYLRASNNLERVQSP